MNSLSLEGKTLKGTTTIALTCNDGVVLASDKRATYGYFVASKEAQKIFKIGKYTAMTVAGSVGDAESLARFIRAEAELYRINNQKEMSSEAVATLLSNILQGNKYFPYLVQLLVCGYDDGKTSRIFSLDPVGGLTEESSVSTGSGSPIAYGILEHYYIKDKSIKENLPIAIHALNAALERDVATGNGINLVTINSRGYREYKPEEIREICPSKKQ